MNYSQNDEQDVILKYFRGAIGRFLDIGAHDGESLSNTRALVLLGWQGVFVEPNPTHFLKLMEKYGGNPRFTLFNCAVSSGQAIAKLFWNYEPPGYSSTISPEKAEEFKANDYTKSFYVSTLPVSKLESFGPFDFVSIDTEGMEVHILSNIRDVVQGTKMICVEVCPKSKDTIEKQLFDIGFDVFHRTPENVLAIVRG